MPKNIELELRAEVLKEDFNASLQKLKKIGKLISETNRLSVMFFGNSNNNIFDLRIRITNGEPEIVIKTGDWHSSDRKEYSQNISPEQFMGMVNIISQFGFDSKVGERKTYNFEFPDKIIVSLVRAGNLSYLEIEKMTDEINQKNDKKELRDIAKKLNVELIEDKERFDNFCARLLKTGDWKFNNSNDDCGKLKSLLKKHIKR